jgi:hypothetical protein
MRVKSPGWLVLGVAVLTLTSSLPEHARSQPPPVQTEEYKRTLSALQRYRLLADEDDGAALPETEIAVEPGDHYDGVPRLIRLLKLIGDLPDDVVEDTDLYKGALVAAVQRFPVPPWTPPRRQHRHNNG